MTILRAADEEGLHWQEDLLPGTGAFENSQSYFHNSAALRRRNDRPEMMAEGDTDSREARPFEIGSSEGMSSRLGATSTNSIAVGKSPVDPAAPQEPNDLDEQPADDRSAGFKGAWLDRQRAWFLEERWPMPTLP